MRHFKLLSILLLTFSLKIYSQETNVEWILVDSNFVDFAIDPADNIITLSNTQSGFEVNKFTNEGDVLWSKSDSHSITDAQKIKVNDSGEIYVFGNRREYDYSITRPLGQGIYRTFHYYKTSFCIVKYNESGGQITYTEHGPNTSLYGIQINSVSLNHEDNIFICARTVDSLVIDTCLLIPDEDIIPGGNRLDFIVQLSNDGSSLVWKKEYPHYILPKSGSLDSIGNYLIVGLYYGGGILIDSTHSVSSYGNNDGFILKYDPNGEVVWINHIGNSQNDGILAINPHSGNNLFFSAYIDASYGIYKGSPLSSNGYYLEENAFPILCKISENSELVWSKPFLNTHASHSNIKITQVNNNLVLGTNYNIDFQYDNINLHSPNLTNSCIIKTDNLGNMLWFKSFGDNKHRNILIELNVDSEESVYMLAEFSKNMFVDDHYLTSDNGKRYLCKIKFDSTNNQLTQKNSLQDIWLYPNPADETLTIEFSLLPNNSNLQVFSINGQLVIQKKLTKERSQVNVEALDKGIYVLRIYNDNLITTRKLIVN